MMMQAPNTATDLDSYARRPCRSCAYWAPGDELPDNPNAGPCARCAAVSELFAGCCQACYALGFREACSHSQCTGSGCTNLQTCSALLAAEVFARVAASNPEFNPF